MKKALLLVGAALLMTTLAVVALKYPEVFAPSDSRSVSVTSVMSSVSSSSMINVAEYSTSENTAYMRKLGEADALKYKPSAVYAQGKQIVVYVGEVESTLAAYQLTATNKTEADAYNSLLKRKAFCIAAKAAGLAPTKDEILQMVDNERSMVESDEKSQAQSAAYISGYAMTAKEYWKTIRYMDMEESLLYSRYVETLIPAFLKKYKLDPGLNPSGANFAYKDEWKETLEQEALRLIALDDVKKK